MSFKVIHTFLAILFPGNLNNDSSQQYDFLSNIVDFPNLFSMYVAWIN